MSGGPRRWYGNELGPEPALGWPALGTPPLLVGDSTFVLHAHGTGPLESDMFLDIEVMCVEDHSVFWKRVVNIQRAWRRHA